MSTYNLSTGPVVGVLTISVLFKDEYLQSKYRTRSGGTYNLSTGPVVGVLTISVLFKDEHLQCKYRTHNGVLVV